VEADRYEHGEDSGNDDMLAVIRSIESQPDHEAELPKLDLRLSIGDLDNDPSSTPESASGAGDGSTAVATSDEHTPDRTTTVAGAVVPPPPSAAHYVNIFDDDEESSADLSERLRAGSMSEDEEIAALVAMLDGPAADHETPSAFVPAAASIDDTMERIAERAVAAVAERAAVVERPVFAERDETSVALVPDTFTSDTFTSDTFTSESVTSGSAMFNHSPVEPIAQPATATTWLSTPPPTPVVATHIEPMVPAPPITVASEADPVVSPPTFIAEPVVAAPTFVAEPVVAEPVVAAPTFVAEPVVAAPTFVAEPVVAEPVVAEPVVAAPTFVAEPVVAGPVVIEPTVPAPPALLEPEPAVIAPTVAAESQPPVPVAAPEPELQPEAVSPAMASEPVVTAPAVRVDNDGPAPAASAAGPSFDPVAPLRLLLAELDNVSVSPTAGSSADAIAARELLAEMGMLIASAPADLEGERQRRWVAVLEARMVYKQLLEGAAPSRQQTVTPAELAEAEILLRDLLDAEGKARRSMSGPKAFKKFGLARRRLDAYLENYGVETIEELREIATTGPSSAGPVTLAEAGSLVADAEHAWQAVGDVETGGLPRSIEADGFRLRCYRLIGSVVDDAALEPELRRRAEAPDEAGIVAGRLADAIRALGMPVGDDPVATARTLVGMLGQS
jgi:hypothetical protein